MTKKRREGSESESEVTGWLQCVSVSVSVGEKREWEERVRAGREDGGEEKRRERQEQELGGPRWWLLG